MRRDEMGLIYVLEFFVKRKIHYTVLRFQTLNEDFYDYMGRVLKLISAKEIIGKVCAGDVADNAYFGNGSRRWKQL